VSSANKQPKLSFGNQPVSQFTFYNSIRFLLKIIFLFKSDYKMNGGNGDENGHSCLIEDETEEERRTPTNGVADNGTHEGVAGFFKRTLLI
jgi:hypothetical protein